MPGTAIALGMALTGAGFLLVPLTSSTGGLVLAVLGISVVAMGDGPLSRRRRQHRHIRGRRTLEQLNQTVQRLRLLRR